MVDQWQCQGDLGGLKSSTKSPQSPLTPLINCEAQYYSFLLAQPQLPFIPSKPLLSLPEAATVLNRKWMSGTCEVCFASY